MIQYRPAQGGQDADAAGFKCRELTANQAAGGLVQISGVPAWTQVSSDNAAIIKVPKKGGGALQAGWPCIAGNVGPCAAVPGPSLLQGLINQTAVAVLAVDPAVFQHYAGGLLSFTCAGAGLQRWAGGTAMQQSLLRTSRSPPNLHLPPPVFDRPQTSPTMLSC